MKLLPKSEIHQRKALEQKQVIDEGVKITRRIDSLREVMASEETTLEKFRSETLAQIHKETTQAADKRDVLLGEVRELEAAKREALKPLTQEQKAIDEAKAELELKEAEIASQALTQDVREQTISEKKRELSLAEEKATQREDRTIQELKDAASANEQAQTVLHNAKQVETEALNLKERVTNELVHREKACANHENSIILREEQLKADQAELAKEWRLLSDRKGLFERTINRVKK